MDDILQQKINEHGSLQAYYAWLDRPSTHISPAMDDLIEAALEIQDREFEQKFWADIAEELREHPERFEPADDPVEPAPEPPPVEIRNASEDDDLPDFLRPNY